MMLGCYAEAGAGLGGPSGRGGQPQADLALGTASKDLGCPRAELHIALTLDRRLLNGNAIRYLIEGCGQRATYVESCYTGSDTPKGPGYTQVDGSTPLFCRDFLVARVPLPPP
jgi:hypothetical protein